MKTVVLLHLFSIVVAFSQMAAAQQKKPAPPACQEIDLHLTPAQSEIIKEFLGECLRNDGYFVNDKGVVLLRIHTAAQSINDPKGILRWDISYSIDDGFMRDNSIYPTKYFDYEGDLVLVWQNGGEEQPTDIDTAAIKQCIWDKVGDRLYLQPPKKRRWSNQKSPDGRLLEGKSRVRLGGGGYHIIFYKDGTYTKTPMA